MPGFEHRTQPLLSKAAFLRRVARFTLFSFLTICFGLGVGILGYRWFEGFSWIDSFLNSAMILSGMGPASELHTNSGKLFAGTYALFSGLIFLVAAGLFFTPIFHRLLHHFHLDE